MLRWGPGGLRFAWCLVMTCYAVAAYAPHALAQDVADAQDEERGRQSFERGRIHYDNGDFQRAAEAFQEAYRLSKKPGLLYNLYLAYRDANQPERAAEALRGFLEQVEVVENRVQLEARLAALEAGIARRKAELAQRVEVESVREAAPQEAAEPGTRPAAERWWLWPTTVVGAGALIALASIPTGVMSLQESHDLEQLCSSDTECDAKHEAKGQRGERLALATDVLWAAGAVVAVGGAVWLLLSRPREEAAPQAARQVSPELACSREFCGGGVSLRF